MESTQEFGLFIFNSAEQPTTCKLVYESDTLGTAIEQQDYLLIYVVKSDFSTSDHQFPILLGHTKFGFDTLDANPVEWTFWNGNTFGDVADALPVFSVDGPNWGVIRLPQLGAYVAAFGYQFFFLFLL